MMKINNEEFAGLVYILVNLSFPKYVKIGYTEDLETTLATLNIKESLPFPYQVYAYYGYKTPLSNKAVEELIDSVNPYIRKINTFEGIKGDTEFYEIKAPDAYHMLQYIATTTYTIHYLHLVKKEEKLNIISDHPSVPKAKESNKQKNISNKNPQKAERFSFTKCGIKPGSIITYIDDPSITAVVVDEHNVEYEGEIYPTSKLAQKITGLTRPIQGTIYWKYKGELLTERRARLEKEGLYK